MSLLITVSNYVNPFLVLYEFTAWDPDLEIHQNFFVPVHLFLENISTPEMASDSLKNFSQVYYQEEVQDQIQHLRRDDWILSPRLQIYCLVSGKRSGSTLIIDYLQKMYSKEIFALSEIFMPDNAYMESFDIINTKGILNKDKHCFQYNTGDYGTYFKQFTDYVESKFIYQKFVFKFTMDFLKDYEIMKAEYNKIQSILATTTVFYLNRNELQSYISLKLAQKFGYSNVVYPSIDKGIYSLLEFYRYSQNKHSFENKVYQDMPIQKYLDYEMMDNRRHYEQISWIRGLFDLCEPDHDDFQHINKKQNMFNYSFLCDKYFWE